MENFYELGRQHALQGWPKLPEGHAKFGVAEDSYWYYEFGFREITTIGWK